MGFNIWALSERSAILFFFNTYMHVYVHIYRNTMILNVSENSITFV